MKVANSSSYTTERTGSNKKYSYDFYILSEMCLDFDCELRLRYLLVKTNLKQQFDQ